MAGRKEMLMRLRGGEGGENVALCQLVQAWDLDTFTERGEEMTKNISLHVCAGLMPPSLAILKRCFFSTYLEQILRTSKVSKSM